MKLGFIEREEIPKREFKAGDWVIDDSASDLNEKFGIVTDEETVCWLNGVLTTFSVLDKDTYRHVTARELAMFNLKAV